MEARDWKRSLKITLTREWKNLSRSTSSQGMISLHWSCLELFITKKSSCVNARGLPTAAYQVLHLLSCTGGWGTSCRGGGYPYQGVPHPWPGGPGVPPIWIWLGYPHPRLDRGTSWGVPHPLMGWGSRDGVPSPGWTWWGTLIWTWPGYPPSKAGWGYPPPLSRDGVPPPSWTWLGVPPPPNPGMGYPNSWTWPGYPP